jgi:two-component system chemotaxis sensor kinase CheA
MAFSTHDIDQRTQEFLLIALLVLVGSVVMTALASLRLHQVVSTPISHLSQATEQVLETQDFSIRVARSTSDEVGALTEAFNAMLVGLEARDKELAEHRENLEQKVAQRTWELNRRNQAMRMVLDNVDQGLATLDTDGALHQERSRAFDALLGAERAPSTMAGCLEQADPEAGEWFLLGWESLTDGFLPLEVALEQLPSELVHQGRHLHLAYKPITIDGQLEQILVILTDRTADVERELTEAAQREFLGVFERIMRDKRGFMDFTAEADRLMGLVCADPPAQPELMMRRLHTLKGNFGLFGLHSLAHLCHELESHWEEHGSLKPRQREELESRWGSFRERTGRLLGSTAATRMEIQPGDYQAALDALEAGGSREVVLQMMRRWTFEPARSRLEAIASQARQIAASQGKEQMQVHIQDNGVRMQPERWKPFWGVFTHALRNAIDHGVETEQERRAQGKQGASALSLRTFYVEDRCVVELADNGRGINWERVAQKAQDCGLPHQSTEDLIGALFSDGFSTRDEVSELSGRGAGLAAVRQVVQEMGGAIHVQSSPGEGTTFHFHIPLIVQEEPAQPTERPASAALQA